MFDLHATITMVGASGMGKSCYMLSMYNEMRQGVCGFTFSTDPDTDLDLDMLWCRMLESGEQRWPPPNDDNPIDYTFAFEYGYKKIISFDWLDYRGGALYSSSTAPDISRLIAQLVRSDCVLLCVSGEYLNQPGRLQEARKACYIDRMNLLLSRVRAEAEHSGRALPAVVIVLTKYDYCARRLKEEILADIHQLFTPLFAKGGEWLIAICPITLGIGLASNNHHAAIVPENVHLPVAFATYYVLQQRAHAAERATRKTVRKISQRQKKLGDYSETLERLNANWWTQWWKQAKIAALEGQLQAVKEKLEEDRKRLKLNEMQRQRMLDNMSLLLGELIRGLPVFNDGEAVELDI